MADPIRTFLQSGFPRWLPRVVTVTCGATRVVSTLSEPHPPSRLGSVLPFRSRQTFRPPPRNFQPAARNRLHRHQALPTLLGTLCVIDIPPHGPSISQRRCSGCSAWPFSGDAALCMGNLRTSPIRLVYGEIKRAARSVPNAMQECRSVKDSFSQTCRV